jgi:hypothetical protein
VTDEKSLEIASGLVGSSDYRSPDLRGVARSLKALLPELAEPWAVIKLQPVSDAGEPPRTCLLSLVSVGGALPMLWTATVDPADDPKYEWPKLIVKRFGSLRWGLNAVSDSVHRDGSHEAVLRVYSLKIGDGLWAFTTDEIVDTPPSSLERFGRELAAADGWPVGGVKTDVP